MDMYSQWIHDLAMDIALDKRGIGVRFIDLLGNDEYTFEISHGEEEEQIKTALKNVGVMFKVKFEHTIVVYSYPPDMELEL